MNINEHIYEAAQAARISGKSLKDMVYQLAEAWREDARDDFRAADNEAKSIESRLR